MLREFLVITGSGLLVLALVALTEPASLPAGRIPLIAMPTPGQLVPPADTTGNGLTETFWWFVLDQAAGSLMATGNLRPVVGFTVRLVGPAPPGAEGPVIQQLAYGPQPVLFNGLTAEHVLWLKRGLVSIEATEHSSVLSRGQIVPIEGVRWP